jgi:hypothetical protein
VLELLDFRFLMPVCPLSHFGAMEIGLMIVSFTEYVLWIVRMYAAAEMSMNSVERVSECKSIPLMKVVS